MRSLIASAVVVIVAACSGPTISSSATFAPQDTGGPTPGATTNALPSEGAPATSAPASAAPATAAPVSLQVLPPGAAVEVVVPELNLRRKPSTSAKRLATLRRGDVMIISPSNQLSFGWGPVRSGGYTWYPAMRPVVADRDLKLDPLPKPPLDVADGEPLWGWIATDDGSRSYVAQVAPRCPTTVDLLNVTGMLPAERLACFNDPIVLEGTFGCPGCGAVSTGEYKPAWLATPIELDFLSLDPADRIGPLAVRFPPDGPPRPAAGSIVRMTVHVDDPRSTRCTMREFDGLGGTTEIDDRTAVLYCRERLVVDAYEVLGTDPSFPPG